MRTDETEEGRGGEQGTASPKPNHATEWKKKIKIGSDGALLLAQKRVWRGGTEALTAVPLIRAVCAISPAIAYERPSNALSTTAAKVVRSAVIQCGWR